MKIKYLIAAAWLLAGCSKGAADTAQPAPAAAAAGTAVAVPATSQREADELCYQVRYGDDAEKVAKLLDGGISPDVHDSNGLTPLVTALMQGSGGSDETQARLVDLLLARGASVNLDNGAALLAAVGYGKTALAQKLLDKGADVNAAGADGFTPLMAAVRGQSFDLASLLLGRGANAGQKAANGKNAWKIAFENAYSFRNTETMKIEELLRGRTSRAEIEALLRADASLKGSLDVDKWLQEHP